MKALLNSQTEGFFQTRASRLERYWVNAPKVVTWIPKFAICTVLAERGNYAKTRLGGEEGEGGEKAYSSAFLSLSLSSQRLTFRLISPEG